jgi:hypothetical protein
VGDASRGSEQQNHVSQGAVAQMAHPWLMFREALRLKRGLKEKMEDASGGVCK